ncbi:hypothetical protein V2A60_004058 [Cordyceps javanica]
MRFSILALALGAAASAIPGSSSSSSLEDCFREHHDDLALSAAECGSPPAVSRCLSRLGTDVDVDATTVEACFASAGCSSDEAARQARHALARCDEIQAEKALELRRRRAEAAAMAMITPAPNPLRVLAARENARGDDCFTTDVHDEKICPGFVSGTSQPCHQGPVTAKSCRPGWICTEDPNGTEICMTKVDRLDIGGIIIAIAFSVFILAGIAFLIFMSCAESRAQKKIKARAEATALARAATRKKRADEVRAPLMGGHHQQQQQQQTTEYHPAQGASVNPFGDGRPH